VIGGTVPQLGGGSRSGKSDLFIAEACEYDRSFHNLHPKIAIITNIDRDHLDCYGTFEALIESFRKFAQLVPNDGTIITHGEDAAVASALQGIKAKIERCSLSPQSKADWTTRIIELKNGCHRGEISYKGNPLATISLSIPGAHNLINATMAIAACRAVGIDPQRAADAIGKFTGVARRMTEVGKFNGAIIVDDYGHHPTEIRATLKALREKYQPKRLICVFQPHQASRTRLLLDEFATCFIDATETLLPDIYSVRDSDDDRAAVNSSVLAARIRANGQEVKHLPTFEMVEEYLRREARAGDVIVTMGAGTVWEIGKELVD
jgi:UDP-N-acetylmuramate--alanine ligase